MIQTRIRCFVTVLLIAVFSGTISADPHGILLNKRQAKKLSDAFMADLAADRVSEATAKLEPSWLRSDGRHVLQPQLDRCGRPLAAQAENEGKPVIGEDVLPDGNKKPSLTFSYLSSTSKHRKYRFHVVVESGDDGKYYIAGFGCGKQGVSKAPLQQF